MAKAPKAPKKKPGPKAETLRVEGVRWEDAVRHALTKPKMPKDERGRSRG